MSSVIFTVPVNVGLARLAFRFKLVFIIDVVANPERSGGEDVLLYGILLAGVIASWYILRVGVSEMLA